MNQIELKALAKINLGLDVLGRRENGYHDVRMVMQSIYLYDEVKIVKKKEPGITLTTNLKFLPTGDGNIAYKAAQLLMDEFDLKEGVQITLNKHIPVAAGLAGGSSNAAAVLFGMNRLFGLHLTQQQLMERGVKLGADVPYCIMRGTVLAEGIGEELSVLPAMPKCTVLIAKPPISVSTKMVYEALDSKEIVEHPDIDGILEGLRKGDLHKVADSMGNVLEDVTIPMHPVIADIKRGDIAKTAEMYAMGHFTGDFEADFVTLAPYMGLDSISPYLPYAEKQGKGMFVLCRTSNGGAKDFEYEKLADGRHVYDLVGDKLNALGKDYMGEHGYSSIGLVIGGTHIEEATEIRAKYQDSFFLIPGYGAQGGKAEDIAQYLTKGNGGVVNSSRGILLAYKKQPGAAFDEAAYNECVNMKEAIAHACSLL